MTEHANIRPRRPRTLWRALGLLVLLGAALPGNSRATVSLGAWIAFSPDDISGFTTLSGNDTTATPTIPFSVTVEGVTYTTVTVSTNGWLEFGGNTQGTSDAANACLPTSKHTNPFVAFYWDDLQTEGTAIRYGTSGTSPNRTFIIDFQENRVAATGDKVNGQVQIHERSNVINVRYRDVMSPGANGQTATIGFQGAGGSSGTARPLTCNGKILDDDRPDEGWSVDVSRADLVPLFAVMESSPNDISGFTTLSGDNAIAGVTLPFSVTIEGTSYSGVTIGTNGLIQFGTTSGANPTGNASLPSSSFPNPTLFYYWDDLQTEGSNIRYGTVGSSPNRTFIVDFQENRVAATGDKVNGQVQIHERSNLINVKYRSTLSAGANGQTATIGFQGAGGSSAVAYPLTFNGKILDDNRPDDGWSVFALPLGAMVLYAVDEFSPDDISGFTTLSGDNAIAGVTLPFSVSIDGTSYSTATIGTNGLIQFGTTTGANPTTNASLPSSSFPNPTIFYYWDDLQTEVSNIQYGTVGTSPNRTFIVDFQENLVASSGDKVNGQVQIHERSNVIDVRYRSTISANANGQSATIGFQGAGGASATAYPLTFNGKILDDNRPNSGWSVSPLPVCGNGAVETKEQCDQGAANGTTASCCTSSCTFKTAGISCRAAADLCDVAETCSGSSATCPADGFASSSTVCRVAADECDLAESCPGNGPSCPADAKKSAGTACTSDGNPCTLDQCDGTSVACQHLAGNAGVVCRASGGVCDPQETCSGTSTTCPADAKTPAGTVCRPATDVCDVAESCDGVTNNCPADGFASAAAVCRAAADECDLAENCTGTGPSCPADAKKAAGTACTSDGNPCTNDQCDGTSVACQHPTGNAGTVCRASAGACDVAETCTGTSSTCPADGFASSATQCRAAAGECDQAENCPGSGPSCPADAKKASGTACTDDGNACTTDECDGSSDACQHSAGNAGAVCRPIAGACDVAETCTGTSSTCPADGFSSSSTICRPAAGECDEAESCTGTGPACPADAKKASGTACTDDGNPCTTDACDGTSDACQHPAGNTGSVCRAAAGVCDADETCDGTSSTCPPDGFLSAFTECRPSAGECDPAENCTGSGPSCPADAKSASGTACSDDGTPCTTDTCDGTNDACQHAAGNAGTVCRIGSGDVCDPDEVCTGVSSTCPPDVVLPNVFACRPAAGECDIAETCGGLPGQPCPADAKKAAGSLCTDDGNPCTTDACDGTSDACQHPAGNAGTVCRATAGPCDLDETCDGTSTSCPADVFQPSTVVCRPSAGECDPAENCTGTGPTCPADDKTPAGTPCTDDGSACTTDTCDGTNDACQHPAGNAGAVCRASAGACDVDETCDGTSTTCPTDAFEPSSIVCRLSAGECDPAENCPGTGPACPADDKSPAGTPCTDDGNSCTTDACDGTNATCQHPAGNAGAVCRPIAGPCDVDETCDGTSSTCPPDGFLPGFTVCRASAGECDATETCTGAGPACPADGKVAAGTPCTDDGNPCTSDACNGSSDICQHPAGNPGALCRASAGPCDADETCDGTNASCPTDAFQPATVVCRAAAGACDVAENCTGSGAACPPDDFQPASVVCRPTAGPCDVAENCTGTGPACPADGFTSAGGAFVCRPAAGACDVAETCDGTGAACPADTFQPASTVCRASQGACDPAENCPGTGPSCPADAKSSTVCRAAAGPCDVPESCDGVGNDCPADQKSTAVCRAATGVCDIAESCDGVSNTCPADAHQPDGTTCSDGNSCTTGDACQGGTCVATPDADGCTDDFLCYKVKTATAFTPIPNILLADIFEPSAHYDVKKPKHLCTPANKNNEGALDPLTHLKSYQIKAVTGSPRFLKRLGNKMANQLAPHPILFLDAIKPDLLLVPTAKSLSTPSPTLGPNTVNHYKCYKAKVTSGTPPFPKGVQVTVADQFRTTAGTFDVKKPKHLCTPVSKNSEPIPNPDAYLVCYLAKPAKGVAKHVPVTPVYVNNQLGPETLKTIKEDELCIPSLKMP